MKQNVKENIIIRLRNLGLGQGLTKDPNQSSIEKHPMILTSYSKFSTSNINCSLPKKMQTPRKTKRNYNREKQVEENVYMNPWECFGPVPRKNSNCLNNRKILIGKTASPTIRIKTARLETPSDDLMVRSQLNYESPKITLAPQNYYSIQEQQSTRINYPKTPRIKTTETVRKFTQIYRSKINNIPTKIIPKNLQQTQKIKLDEISQWEYEIEQDF